MSFDPDVDLFVEVGFTNQALVVAEGWASAPDSAGLSVTGDIDLRFFGAAESWVGVGKVLIYRFDANQASYSFRLNTVGKLNLALSEDGTALDVGSASSTVPVDAADGELLGLRATWRASDSRVQFFTSTDDGATWTQLGSDQTLDGSVTGIHNSTDPVFVGATSSGGEPFVGRIKRAEIRNGIGGTVGGGPDFSDPAEWTVGEDVGDTGTDSAGNTWTLAGDAIIAESTRPFDPLPTWTDVTDACPALEIRRGKSTLVGHYEAGIAILHLENIDGRFTPSNTAGAHYPNVKIGNQVRVRAVHAASSTDAVIFRGLTEAWPLRFPAAGGYATVDVPCVDPIQLFHKFPLLGVTFPAQTTSERVHAVLDTVDFPQSLRDVEDGVAELPAITFEVPTSALEHLRDVAFAEVGQFFVAADGSATFINRIHFSGGAVSAATFGPANLTYVDIGLSYDDDFLWNEARLTAVRGTEQIARNQESIEDHGRRVYPVEGEFHLLNDPHALNVAEWVVDLFGDQDVKIRSLVLAPPTEDLVWEQALNRDIADSVTVIFEPPGGDTFNQAAAIDGVSHSITVDTWFTTWNLAPLTDLQTTVFWALGVSNDLDVDTVLA